jgi:putative sigma-54 modulation protein
MNINYTWRNATKSESIEDLLHKKLEKLERHFDKVSQIHVIFETHGKQEHTAKATVHLPGIEINAHATDEDMYKAVDAMAHKLIRQVESHKDKINSHKGKCCDHEHNEEN